MSIKKYGISIYIAIASAAVSGVIVGVIFNNPIAGAAAAVGGFAAARVVTMVMNRDDPVE